MRQVILLFKSLVPFHIRRLATGKVVNVRAHERRGEKHEKPTSVEQNITRGNQSMSHVLATKKDVHDAMYREGIGWIDFVWGSVGSPATKSGKRKGASGIAHILEARQRKDGMSLQQAKTLAMMIVQTIANGRIVREKEHEAPLNVLVCHRRYEAVLVKVGAGNGWILSGWKSDE